jgi:transcriptional regulator with GAF, ATPase, and Fis domain
MKKHNRTKSAKREEMSQKTWKSVKSSIYQEETSVPVLNLYALRGLAVAQTMEVTNWNYDEAAAILGSSTESVRRWVREYGITKKYNVSDIVNVGLFAELTDEQKASVILELVNR